MFFLFHNFALVVLCSLGVTALAGDDCCPGDTVSSHLGREVPFRPVLRVAADPNNLPFSNDREEGFENKIARVIADSLGFNLQYSWRAQRRGFFRETLKENRADLILGLPAHFDLALTTRPYYRSTYVFVYRADSPFHLQSLDDPLLRRLKIGVQIIGDDGVNPPPAHALARRGIIDNVAGFTVYGDYAEANPPARIIDAVAKGGIDVAIVWGPLGGYFARQSTTPLQVVPVAPAADPGLPFTFSIAMGVRKSDKELRDEINHVLIEKEATINAILDHYGVPRLEGTSSIEMAVNR